jgi:hypothetical protein
LELRLEIQEFLRPLTGLGALRWVPGERVDGVDGVGKGFCSTTLASLGSASSATLPRSFEGSFPCSAVLDGGAGLLLERFLRCDLDDMFVFSLSPFGFSLVDEEDFVR